VGWGRGVIRVKERKGKWKNETFEIPGMGRGRIKENYGGVNSTMIYYKNFCKCYSAPPA
jgi:hypothetical protein